MNSNQQQTAQLEPGVSALRVGMSATPRPEFIRLPKSGSLCPWSGLSRSKLNEIILPSPGNGFRPPVRSVSLRSRGQVKGVRLINFYSLLIYLRSLEDSSEDGGTMEATNGAPNFPMAQEPLETCSQNQSPAHLPRTGERQYR